jgi:hypothetical protein
MSLPVDILAVADAENRNGRAAVIDVVENTIDSDANPPVPVAVFQLLASGWAWVFGQRQQSPFDRFVPRRGDGMVVFLRHRQDDYPVPHLRFRRFSASACSKGIGVSPKAFASSHARMSSRSSSSSSIFSYSSMLMTTAIFSPFSLVRYCVGAFMVSPLAKSSAAEHERQQSTAEDALGLRSLMCA